MIKFYNYLVKNLHLLFLLIFILFISYIFYKSEIYWDGNKREYYLIYYFAASSFLFFSLIIFYLNDKIKEYVLIVSISIFIAIYVCEIYLTLRDKPLTLESLEKSVKLTNEEQTRKEFIYKKKTGKNFDKRTGLEIYEELKSKNKKIAIKVPPTNYLKKELSVQPLSGISNSETISCNENGYYSMYFSDRYGFNNPDYEWSKEEIEYLLVGDSFTFGECLDRPYDIASILRVKSKKSVLNLGYGSNGPLIYYATLREYLNSNVNNVLILFHEGSDLINLTQELENKILRNYLNDINFSQNLKSIQNKIDQMAHDIINEQKKTLIDKKNYNLDNLFYFDILQFIKFYNLRQTIIYPKYNVKKEFTKILKMTKELTFKKNAKLYFVYLPDYQRYKLNNKNKNYSDIVNIVNKLNIPFIDIHQEVFDKEVNPLDLFPFGLYGHYNKEGYYKVADTIFKLTSNQN